MSKKEATTQSWYERLVGAAAPPGPSRSRKGRSKDSSPRKKRTPNKEPQPDRKIFSPANSFILGTIGLVGLGAAGVWGTRKTLKWREEKRERFNREKAILAQQKRDEEEQARLKKIQEESGWFNTNPGANYGWVPENSGASPGSGSVVMSLTSEGGNVDSSTLKFQQQERSVESTSRFQQQERSVESTSRFQQPERSDESRLKLDYFKKSRIDDRASHLPDISESNNTQSPMPTDEQIQQAREQLERTYSNLYNKEQELKTSIRDAIKSGMNLREVINSVRPVFEEYLNIDRQIPEDKVEKFQRNLERVIYLIEYYKSQETIDDEEASLNDILSAFWLEAIDRAKSEMGPNE